MKYARLLLPFAALSVFAPFCAQVASAAERPGITYDCDSASGHFSELVLPAPDGDFTVAGHLQVNQIAEIGKFAPLARLGIGEAVAPGGSSPDLAGFVLSAIPAKMIDPKVKDARQVVQYVQWDEVAGGAKKEHELFGVSRSGEVVDFNLAFSQGSVTVRIAGQEQRFALKASSPTVRIVCSTGEFLFTDLRIEKAG